MWGCSSRFCPQVCRMLQHADLSSQVLGIARDLDRGLGAGGEQQIVKQSGVLQGQHVEFVRHREDHVKIAGGKQFLFPRGEPALAGLGLALRAMAIPAGVIGDGRWTIAAFLAVLGTGIEMAAQSRGPAVADGAEHLPLLIAEACPVAVQKTIALRAEDVGHLHGGPCHVLLLRLKPWRASFTSESGMLSSGLMTACRCLADRCRYFAVVSRSPCPSST